MSYGGYISPLTYRSIATLYKILRSQCLLSKSDFCEIFFVYLVGMRIGRIVFFTLLPPPPLGAKTGILRLTMEIFVYKWMLLYFNNNKN